MLFIPPHIRIPDGELRFTFVRSSGPGGQNVNKLNTKAVLRWAVAASPSVPGDVRSRFLQRFARRITNEGEIVLTGQRFRDQKRNQCDCLEKLREMIASVAAPPKRRKPTRPTKSSIQRRRTRKRAHSLKKQRRQGPLSEE